MELNGGNERIFESVDLPVARGLVNIHCNLPQKWNLLISRGLVDLVTKF
jgi:hypothetical protein